VILGDEPKPLFWKSIWKSCPAVLRVKTIWVLIHFCTGISCEGVISPVDHPTRKKAGKEILGP
jgi:hypothetical protein